MLLDRVEQSDGLEGVARGIGAFLFLHAAGIDRRLHGTDDQASADFFSKGIAISQRLLEIVPRIDVQQRERNLGRPERFGREVGHDDRVLAAGKKQRGVLELRRRLTQNENRLSFKLVEMIEMVVRHGVA